MSDDKILDRIKKMLALSKSDNPNEAATALQMAQRLMEKHNLTMSDVGLSVIKESDVRSRFSVSITKQYESALVATVKKAFGVGCLWLPAESWYEVPYGHWRLVGPEDQLAVAAWTLEVLMRRMQSARAKHVAMLKQAGVRGKQLSTEGDTYCLYWVTAVWQMVHEFAQPDTIRDAIKLKIEHQCSEGKTAKQKDSSGGSTMSAALGLKDGKEERLYRPMEGGPEQLKIAQNS